jgi:hypothetical protein
MCLLQISGIQLRLQLRYRMVVLADLLGLLNILDLRLVHRLAHMFFHLLTLVKAR